MVAVGEKWTAPVLYVKGRGRALCPPAILASGNTHSLSEKGETILNLQSILWVSFQKSDRDTKQIKSMKDSSPYRGHEGKR